MFCGLDFYVACCIVGFYLPARLACTIVPIVLCNTVYYAVLLMMNDQILSKHVQQTENCGIKLIIRIVHLVGQNTVCFKYKYQSGRDIINVRRTPFKTSVILSDFKQIRNNSQLLANITNMLFHENQSIPNRAVLCGHMDRQTEAKRHFSQLLCKTPLNMYKIMSLTYYRHKTLY